MELRTYRISICGSRTERRMQTTEVTWGQFLDKIKTPVRTTETYETYRNLNKNAKAELKDAGGFVGGTFEGGIRGASTVMARDMVTLDLDDIPENGTDDILKKIGSLGVTAAVYSTRSHTRYAPKLRVVIPLSRTADPDEYEPVARYTAGIIGMPFTDRVSFRASQVMYWPSCSCDSEYIFESFGNGENLMSVDAALASYTDWRDVTEWPRHPKESPDEVRRRTKLTDPKLKEGAVGAFCRAYSITEAMETFLPGVYEPSAPGRFTYTGGTTANGAVVYDDDCYLYSHHSHDPCCEKDVNSFDLVRIHKFGHLDADVKPGTPIGKYPSYTEMRKFMMSDGRVRKQMEEESEERVRNAFGCGTQGAGDVQTAEVDTAERTDEKLELNENGNVANTLRNAVIMLKNYEPYRGNIRLNEFDGKIYIRGKLAGGDEREILENDYVDLMKALEAVGIKGKDRVYDAVLNTANFNRYNSAREYFHSLKWDGERRVDTALHDYLGAEQTPYTAAALRKSLCAVVRRSCAEGNAGVKFDSMLILVGAQGMGKSTFFRTLAGDRHFTDSLTDFSGKDSMELLQGQLIVEAGELTAFNRTEMSMVKQFLSKQKDSYRCAYARVVETRPRRGIIVGTSNDGEFLRDPTGNRRFWPVDIGVCQPVKDVFNGLAKERDQIWAEAVVLSITEKLYMEGGLEAEARMQQASHSEYNAKQGLIEGFLDRPVPAGWEHMDREQRRLYQCGSFALPEGTKMVRRERVCIPEIWEECLGGRSISLKRGDSNEIKSILMNIGGWQQCKTKMRCGCYGVQRGFFRTQ